MSDALKEALKSGLRTIVLAVIPVLIDSLTKGVVDLRLLLIVGGIAGLRFIDSWLHEHDKSLPKAERNTGLLGQKGLTGF